MSWTSDAPTLPPPLAPGAAERRHIPALDGLRGLAILQVMLFHFTMNTRISAAMGWRLTANAMAVFPSGVELFFVLSGFLITGILLDAKSADRAYFRPFYARRVLRIFPLYYGVLIATFGTLAVLIHLGRVTSGEYLDLFHRQGWLWGYLTNFWLGLTPDTPGTRHVWFGHFWSLALEEQFYLVWPMIVYLCRPKTLARLCVIALFATFIARVYFVIHYRQWFLFYVVRPDGLLVGALLAAVIRLGFEPAAHQKMAWRWFWVLVVLSPFFNATALFVAKFPAAANPLAVVHEFAPMQAVALFAAVMIIALGRPVRTFLENRPLRFLGKISYGVYVYHDLFMPLLVTYAFHGVLLKYIKSPLVIPAFALTGSAVSIGLACVSWYAFEKHVLRLKRFFPYRSTSAQAI